MAMTEAVIWIMAVKLVSVLQARMATWVILSLETESLKSNVNTP